MSCKTSEAIHPCNLFTRNHFASGEVCLFLLWNWNEKLLRTVNETFAETQIFMQSCSLSQLPDMISRHFGVEAPTLGDGMERPVVMPAIEIWWFPERLDETCRPSARSVWIFDRLQFQWRVYGDDLICRCVCLGGWTGALCAEIQFYVNILNSLPWIPLRISLARFWFLLLDELCMRIEKSFLNQSTRAQNMWNWNLRAQKRLKRE